MLVALWSVWYRHTYGTFNPFAAPEKLTAYDREFFNPGPVMTRAEVMAGTDAPTGVIGATSWFPGVTIGRPAIWGFPDAVCDTEVYLQTGPDAFVMYELSGSC